VDVPFTMQGVSSHRNELHEIIDALEADGSTNLHGGLERGYRQVVEHYDSGRQNRVILLSDGEPTAGDTSPESIVSMSRAYNSDGIGLTTVGLGTDFNIDLMRSLAQQADGNFYFVENAAAVDEVFTEELSYFTLPVAFDLELRVTAGQDYTFARAVGSQAWQDTEEGGTLEIPSVFLAHRTSHDDVTDEGGRRGGGSALLIELMPREEDGTSPTQAEVATLELSFREPGTDRVVTETLDVSYPHAPWEVLSTGFFENGIVTKSFVMLNIYAGLESACATFHEGDPIASIVTLDRLIAAAEDYEDSANGGEGDVDIQLDIELMEDLIEVILRNGGSQPEDVEIDEDPWPAD
jgi:Ca-activated chloride channel family protein